METLEQILVTNYKDNKSKDKPLLAQDPHNIMIDDASDVAQELTYHVTAIGNILEQIKDWDKQRMSNIIQSKFLPSEMRNEVINLILYEGHIPR